MVNAGETVPAPAEPAKAEGIDWTRWNDLGIAMFRQNDTRGAEEAFADVDRLRPDLPDGPRNLARVRMAQGDYYGARDLLVEAEKRAPGDPRLAFWFGRVHLRTGEHALAAEAFERSLRSFPGDRNALADLAQVHFETGEVEKSLEAWLRVLEIDPENANAHYHRSLCYERMGREADAAEARKSFDRYKTDELAPERTNAYLRGHPPVNREAQPIHVHDLEPAR